MLLAHQRQTDDIKFEPMQSGKVEGSFFDASTDDTAQEQENVWMMKGSHVTLAAAKDTSRESVNRKVRGKCKRVAGAQEDPREGALAEAVPREGPKEFHQGRAEG